MYAMTSVRSTLTPETRAAWGLPPMAIDVASRPHVIQEQPGQEVRDDQGHEAHRDLGVTDVAVPQPAHLRWQTGDRARRPR